MNAQEIDDIAEGWSKLTDAIVKALKADKTLIDKGDRWLPTPDAYDIHYIEASIYGDRINGTASVYTMQTGGSTEHLEFTIPLDTLNKYL